MVQKSQQMTKNYRPISLRGGVASLMEKLLNTQILRYLQSHSLIFQHRYQSGFLPEHSTVTQLCFLVQKWQMAIDKREHVQAAFLDLSKAYDRVGIPGLIGKLSALGFSRSSLSWLRSFLTNRKHHGSLRSQASHKGQCWDQYCSQLSSMTCCSLSPVSVPSLQMTALPTLPGKTHS